MTLGTRGWVLVGIAGIIVALALSPLHDAWVTNDAGILVNRVLAAEAGGIRPADTEAIQRSMERLAAAAARAPHTNAREIPIWRTYGSAAALAPSDHAFELLARAGDMGQLDRWGELWLAEVASMTGHWDEAREAYQKIDASNLLMSRADTYLESGEQEAAARQYSLAKASLDAAVERETAELLLLGHTGASAGHFMAFSAEQVTALYRIGRGLLSAGQPAQAITVLEEAHDKAVVTSPGAMEEQSLNLNLALALAQTLPEQPKSAATPGDSPHCDEVRSTVLTRIRTLAREATEDGLTGSVCVLASRVYRLIGDVGHATAMLRKAIEIDPLFPDAHLALGAWYESEGMNMSARRVYEKAIEQLPANLEITVAYAIAAYMSLPAEEALPLLKQASETETDDPYLFAFLGDCYLELGQEAMARIAYEEGLRRAPQAEPLTNRLASLDEMMETLP